MTTMDEKANQHQAEIDLREAKRAYKQARKNAGKTNTGRVIGMIIYALFFFIVGGVLMWCFGDDMIPFAKPFGSSASSQAAVQVQETSSNSAASTSSASSSSTGTSSSNSASSQEATSTSSNSSTSANSASASSATSGTAASASSASSTPQSTSTQTATTAVTPTTSTATSFQKDKLVGTWKGSMTSSENTSSSKKVCYGASEHPLELTIDSLEPTGRIKGSAKVLVHGHELDKLDRDIDSHSSDKVLELSNIISTYYDDSIEFVADTSTGEKVVITLEPAAAVGSKQQIQATVTCGYAKDTYLLSN